LKKALGLLLAVQVFLFQVFLLTEWRPLYAILKAGFFVLFGAALAFLVRRLMSHKILWLVLGLVVLVRVPFYLHPEGMVTTSDNAVDALGAAEIRDARTAPFFLLGAVKHMGTIKQLWVAFVWDVVGGNAYLFYLLLQLAVFLAFLLTWDAFLEETVPRNARFLLLALGFAFIEAVLDYSLSIRGAPYLEMALFALFGAALFDRTWRDKTRLFLAYYFLFFAVYIHPLAAVLAGSFGLSAALYALVKRKFWLNLAAGAAGAFAGLFHWAYYLAFVPKPVAAGAWEEVGLLPLRLINQGWIPEYIKTLKQTFVNIFDFELSYLSQSHHLGGWKPIAIFFDRATIVLAVVALAAALGLAVWKLGQVVRRRRPFGPDVFPHLFFLVLLAAVLAKIFLFFPPHVEPRHNFDAVILIVLAVFLAAGPLLRVRKILSWPGALVITVGLAMAAPHILAFHSQAAKKDSSYAEVLNVLRRNRVKVVDTDFILAYCIYYLSHRNILATDALGPFRVQNFFPEMRARIKALPLEDKAYIVYSDWYPRAEWHKKATVFARQDVLNKLNRAGVRARIYKLRDYEVIIPRKESRAATGQIR
jgi:hypothetical protein